MAHVKKTSIKARLTEKDCTLLAKKTIQVFKECYYLLLQHTFFKLERLFFFTGGLEGEELSAVLISYALFKLECLQGIYRCLNLLLLKSLGPGLHF